MPTSTTATGSNSDLLTRLNSPDSEVQLKALRELKNRIIGNRTKKLSFVKLGLVPAVAAILASKAQAQAQPDHDSNLLVQSAAVLGSFACGFDAGARAVLDAGACPNLFLLLSHPDDKALNLVSEALTHDSSGVRTAACICLRCVSRSIKNLCAGKFMNEMIVLPLVRLLDDPSTSVQVAALSAVGNIIVDFTTHRSLFLQCGGVKQLVQLSKSMDSTLRLNALWALRNLMCLADYMCKLGTFMELTASSLASLICDPEPFVQEQALALIRNLVDGCVESVELVFAEDDIILDAVGRQLQSVSRDEIWIQGLYVLSNVASGNEFHKEAVMHQLVPQADNGAQSFILKFLQSNESQLRIAAVWTIVNLTFPSSPSAYSRFVKLHNAGIVSQVKSMVNDPCPDVKLRVRTALGQFTTLNDGAT